MPLSKTPAARVIAKQLKDRKCLAAILDSRIQDVASGPLVGFSPPPQEVQNVECSRMTAHSLSHVS